jgi:endoglucanase
MRLFIPILLACGLVFATPVSEHGKLSVSNRKILDKNGNEYVLRGMSMFWDKWNEGSKFYNQSVVNTLAGSNWNSNVIRMAASQGQGSLQNAKNFMDWTWSAGIYVIIDWHYHDLDQNGAQNFFSEVARYAKDRGYNHVIYEIFNEPKGPNWAQIKTFAQNVIPKIREHDKDGIILVGTPGMSSSVGSARNDPLSSAYNHNVMYVLHFYAAESGHGYYKYPLQGAWCADFPVFISEWGTSRADGGAAAGNGAAIAQSANDDWMSLIETMGLSWANWSITDKGESSAALRGGASTTGSWSNSNLSPSGQYVQKIIKGRNSGGSLSSVGLSDYPIDCNALNGSSGVQRTGIATFGYVHFAANYKEISNADSSEVRNFWLIENNSNNFSASYTLTEVPKPGTYIIRLTTGSANDGASVSWQGEGLETGSATFVRTGGIDSWEAYETTINITESPIANLNFNFNAGGANSFSFLTFSVREASAEDSLKYGIADELPILPNLKNKQGFEIFGRNLVLRTGGNLEIYSLQGKRMAFFNVKSNETVSLQNLPVGAYVAVLGRERFVFIVRD